jgi:FKBP-type peptidyl-prolyl cis-trans isomerase
LNLQEQGVAGGGRAGGGLDQAHSNLVFDIELLEVLTRAD